MLLYHEKQVAALCGVHCINSLLQGPIFSEVDLAQVREDVCLCAQGLKPRLRLLLPISLLRLAMRHARHALALRSLKI